VKPAPKTPAGSSVGAPRRTGPEPTKSVSVALGSFARSSIEDQFGTNVAAGVRAALVHYTRRLKSGQRPVEVPGAWRQPIRSVVEFELPIDREVWETLEHEAREQEVSIDQLLVHAIFVYLADLDATSPR
jgi:hypothetical protein